MDTARVRSFAAKYLAVHDDGPVPEPTDEALAEAFKNCVLPAKPYLYPAIRKQIQEWS